jgi:methyl-accepting chemotaxis protein
MLCIAIAIIALYFNPKLLIVYGGIVNGLVIALFLISSQHFLGDNNAFPFFLSIFFMINGQIIAMFFLTKWGSSILVKSEENRSDVQTLFNKLQAANDVQKKQAEYQKTGVQNLLGSLEKLSQGELSCNLVVAPPDEDTQEVYKLFNDISERLRESVDSIRTYIEDISKVLAKVSEGNLDVNITSEYKGDFVELKNSINTIVTSISGILSNISIAAEQVAVGTHQVSDGSQAISQGATEQASSVEELTSSVAEIASQTRDNAMKANQANELSVTAKLNAVRGSERMENLQQAMNEINQSSASISKIIKVIDDIAFQTNILALNAAVEAARAGTHGKGFAVVAEEVRNLAARSAGAAKETTELIEGSIRKAATGTKFADETASVLASIVTGVEKAGGLISEIALASNEQATAISQVNNGIEQMSLVVQANSATAEQAAAISEELSSQAQMLNNLVGHFHLNKVNTSNMMTPAEKPLKNHSKTKTEARISADILLSGTEFGKY